MFKEVIEVDSMNIQGHIRSRRYEDYEPEHAEFSGKILGHSYEHLNTKKVGAMLHQIQALYDQMVAIDTAGKLAHEEDEIPEI